jgi:hypothetical protein
MKIALRAPRARARQRSDLDEQIRVHEQALERLARDDPGRARC